MSLPVSIALVLSAVLAWPDLRWLWLSQHSGWAQLRLQLLYEKSLIFAYLQYA